MKFLPNAISLDDSRMSFGEHLEELRSALWKAIVAIFLGFLVGLLLGHHFIAFVKAPLVEGLNQLESARKNQEFVDAGETATDADTQFREEGLVPNQGYLNGERFVELLGSLGVSIDPEVAPPERVELWIWSEPSEAQVIATGVPDTFGIYVKASLVLGVVLASPAVFYFLWTFVAAGLYPHEKRYVHIFLPFSIGLFLLGATVAFYVVLQYVIGFLLGFNAWLDVESTPRIDEWLSFVLILPLMFGIAFQMPLVMLFLERIGVFKAETYLTYWRYAVLAIFVISMVLTPADPQSLMAMAGCLTPLYFGGILLCKWMPRGSTPEPEPAA